MHGNINEIKNASVSNKVLNFDILGEPVQKIPVTLKNLYQEIEEGDSLIFVIEMIQSEKPISSAIEKKYETKWKNLLLQGANRLQNSDDPDLRDAGILLEQILNISEDLSIGGDEWGEFASSRPLMSSAFNFGSNDYASNVKFSTKEGDNKTIYFRKEYSDFQYEFYNIVTLPYEKFMNESKPQGDPASSWPVTFLNLLETDSEEAVMETVLWVATWAVYTLGKIDFQIRDRVTYYLHNDEVMDKTKPKGSTTIRDTLSSDSLKWVGPSFERNKILENITAKVYIQYQKILTLGKVKISATLKNGDTVIASSEMEVDRTNLIEFIKRGPDSPTVIYFDVIESDEVWHNKNLSLEVNLVSKPILPILKPVKILYDSVSYPSSITLAYKETENIEIEGFEDKITYAGGSAEYVFDVRSKHKDKIDITVEEQTSVGDWILDYYPKTVNVGEDGVETVHLFVNSTATDDSAYNVDEISILINATGKTGFDSKSTNVSVSLDAVEYDIEIVKPDDLEIKHGSEGTYRFIIRNNNKGFIEDEYSIKATSEHNLTLNYLPYAGTKEDSLGIYDKDDEKPIEAILNVTITIPYYTDITSDKLTLNITSDHSVSKKNTFSVEISVTTTIVTPNILESLYQLFESAALKIGLSGPYAGWILIGGLILLLILIIIIAALIRRRRFADIICLDRIKEITPDETAEFEITVKNPTKDVLTYEIKTLIDSSTDSFEVSIDTKQAILESKQSKKISLIVKPTDFVKKDDWIEVKVIAKAQGRKKPSEISTVTTIKGSETRVEISGVFHWPRVFKKGDRVETSFKLVNRGNVSARNVSVILYINGEEKNKVEDITIPRGGYADIAMPWVAVKGKNEVYIVVK
jgi:hypothetical protein